MEEQKDTMSQDQADAYWKRNIGLIRILLSIWLFVSLIMSIIVPWAIPAVNNIKIGSLGLGFWFAQQGSIITFVILIFVYCFRMDAIDKEFNVNE